MDTRQKQKVELKVLDITEKLPFETGFFDGVFCTGALHLFPKGVLAKVIKEIDRVLKNGGVFLFDFATDVKRTLPNGKLKLIEGEPSYTKNEAEFLIRDLLENCRLEIQHSTFEDDLTDVKEHGWKSKGNFLLVTAIKGD